jgi:hypothetical protein
MGRPARDALTAVEQPAAHERRAGRRGSIHFMYAGPPVDWHSAACVRVHGRHPSNGSTHLHETRFPVQKKNMKHDFFIISKEGKKICYHFFIISKEGKKICYRFL